MENKKEFVENRLFELIKVMYKEYGEIKVCTYQHHNNTEFPIWEVVYIEIAPANENACDVYITIDVTGDSLLALTKDVLKALEKKI